MNSKRYFAVLAFSVMLVPTMAQAQLLDGLTGGGGLLGGGGGGSESSLLGVVGGADSGALVTLGDNAGSSGAVNLGVGGSEGLVTANLGSGSEPTVSASVLGPSGIVGANLNLGDVGVGANVGGPGLIDVDIRLPRGADGGNGNNGGNGGNGNNGGNGGFGFFGNNGGGGTTIVRTGSGSGFGSNSAACAGSNPNQLLSLFQNTNMNGWNRASSIQLIPIKVCRDIRAQMANWLAANQGYRNMVGQVAGDPLIAAALSRTSYQPGHVLGVQREGQTLMVYVF